MVVARTACESRSAFPVLRRRLVEHHPALHECVVLDSQLTGAVDWRVARAIYVLNSAMASDSDAEKLGVPL